jgi:3-hydroxyisobutyrate dehydrogenase/glyoxylate/succinic semialdehyde reductase
MKIGFIGLGIMGSRMARNLLAKGHDLTVYNRTRAKAEALLAAGAAWAATPAEAAEAVEVLFTMLSSPEVVQTLAAEEDGFLEAMGEGATWVDCSTVNPSFARWMAAMAGAHGVRFLDAPVAGTKGPAESGDLLFLVGGPEDDLAKVRPLLDCMGRKVLHLGGAGQGAAMKMLFNLMLGSAMAAFGEALALGSALGFNAENLGETLGAAPVTAPFLKMKQEMIARGDFEAHFPLRWMRKDLHLVAQTAYEQGLALPNLNLIKEVYALAEKQGLGDQDFAAVYRILAK